MSRPYGREWDAIVKQLTVRRILLGLSQDQVAAAARTSRSAISEMENGKRVLTGELLIRIARVLGLRVALIPGKEPA